MEAQLHITTQSETVLTLKHSSEPTIKPPGRFKSWLTLHFGRNVIYTTSLDCQQLKTALQYYLVTRPENEQAATKAAFVKKCDTVKGSRYMKQKEAVEIPKMTMMDRHFGGVKLYWHKDVKMADAIHWWILVQPVEKREALRRELSLFVNGLKTPELEIDSDSSSEFDEKLG